MSMPNSAALAGVLEKLQLDHWLEPLQALADERMSESAHGDFTRWQEAVTGLRSASGVAEKRALLLQQSQSVLALEIDFLLLQLQAIHSDLLYIAEQAALGQLLGGDAAARPVVARIQAR